jgi:hypothetical protein
MNENEYYQRVEDTANEYVRMAKLENNDALKNIDYDLVKLVCDNESFSLVESAEILDVSENIEEDHYLWENQNPQDAIKSQAYWTFNNDVVVELRGHNIDG